MRISWIFNLSLFRYGYDSTWAWSNFILVVCLCFVAHLHRFVISAHYTHIHASKSTTMSYWNCVSYVIITMRMKMTLEILYAQSIKYKVRFWFQWNSKHQWWWTIARHLISCTTYYVALYSVMCSKQHFRYFLSEYDLLLALAKLLISNKFYDLWSNFK